MSVLELGAAGGPMAVGVTKSEAAYQEIRRRIMDGTLIPGSVLEQETLASTLSLSTTPVREALRRLESERLVTLQAHREVRVAPMSAAELQQIYAVRLELDPLAAGLAAEAATDEQIAAVSASFGQRPGDPIARLIQNRQLHRGIYGACGNQVLIQILDSLWDRSDRYRMVVLKTDAKAASIESEHGAIVLAFARRDAQALRQLMTGHLQESMRSIVQLGGIEGRPAAG
jgi:DNA-binding GntR family transcriptional regulator